VSLPVTHYRFTVDEYHRMGEAGILGPDDRVELIDGEIVMMTPIGSRHAACVDRCTHFFTRLVGTDAIVRVQNPIQLDDYSAPEPDVSLLRPREDFYAGAHPLPRDVLLVVEVADTSIGYDREVKLPLYGSMGIPEVWIVDLGRRCIDAYRGPLAGGYAERRTHRADEKLRPAALDVEVAVADLLP
jgi:Uma2 family endonuclease